MESFITMLPADCFRAHLIQRKKNTFAAPRWWSLLLFTSCCTPNLFAQGVISALEQEIGALIHTVKPAVVTVLAMKKSSGSSEGGGFFKFFDERTETEKEFKVGTGLIISSDGFVLTKDSIVREAGLIEVALDNGTSHRVEWMERDSLRGIALLKISAPDLHPAHFNMSDTLHAGSWVTVIGNCLGVPHAVSVGVVSAIQPDGFVQISANVDPGSNGSPVFDVHTHAIGMVMGRVGLQAAEASTNNFFSNTALVHPFADLLPDVRVAIERYYASHGWIGITVITDASSPSSPRILKLSENGPGHKCGLQVGDTITHFGGKEVDSPIALGELVNQARPGKTMPIKVQRSGQELTFEVRIASKTPVALVELNFEKSAVRKAPETSPVKTWNRGEIKTAPQELKLRIDALEKEVQALRKYYQKN